MKTIFKTGANIALHLLTIYLIKKLTMTTEEKYNEVINRMDVATNNIAAEIRDLKTEISANKDGMTDEAEQRILGKAEALAVRLEGMGTSTTNPFPGDTSNPGSGDTTSGDTTSGDTTSGDTTSGDTTSGDGAEQPIGDQPGQQEPEGGNGTIPSTEDQPSTLPGDTTTVLTGNDATPGPTGDNATTNQTPVNRVAANFPATAKGKGAKGK